MTSRSAFLLAAALVAGSVAIGASVPGESASLQSVRPSARGTVQQNTLHQFSGTPDGSDPVGAIISDRAGNLFGTTQSGGTSGLGSIFELTPQSSGAYAETVLYSFAGSADGANPYGALVLGPGGKLYGTTAHGGSLSCVNGCGTIFELKPSRGTYSERILYSFEGSSDGSFPEATLLLDSTGALYGTAQGGGSTACPGGCGTIYKLTPGASGYAESTLYEFQGGVDGSGPVAGIVSDGRGSFYGTTLNGGGSAACSNGCGTVYKLSSGSDIESVVYTFQGGVDGASPYAGVVIDQSGNLLGTTYAGGNYTRSCYGVWDGISGCGTAFKIAAAGSGYTKTTLHFFKFPESAGPQGGLTFGKGGVLYGTTVFGHPTVDCGPGCGTVYELRLGPDGRYRYAQVFAFVYQPSRYETGDRPFSGVLVSGDTLYGTTTSGGIASACDGFGCGVVFELKLP